MRAIFKSLMLCAVAIWAMSCGGAKEKIYTMDYFNGEFVYFADAVLFYDCATGAKYPVSQSKGYLTTERQYLKLNPTAGERISLEFHGHIEQLPPMEGDGTVATMVIDTLIRFDRTVMCDPNGILSGIYDSSDSTRVETLNLSPDYTFTRTQFVSYRDEVIISGVWGLSSALELVLKPLSMVQTRSAGLSSISSGNADSIFSSFAISYPSTPTPMCPTTLTPTSATSAMGSSISDSVTGAITTPTASDSAASGVNDSTASRAKGSATSADTQTPSELRIEVFQIIPDQHALVANGGGSIIGFKRVFVN